MQELQLRAGVRYQLTKERAGEAVGRVMSEERGEIGSWLILAAGLAVAAGAAVGLLGPWLNTKVTTITSN
jgi:hypothetical protein